MEIDIRTTLDESLIDTIRFGDNEFDRISKQPIKSITIADEDYGEVNFEDIDNLILALKKAKELWHV